MAIKRPTSKPAEQEPVKRKEKASFADAFDAAKSGGSAVDFPIGEFECVITDFVLDGEIAGDVDDQEKLVAIVTFEGTEGAAEGKTIKSRYSLCSEEGEMQGGVGFLKKDLEILGYDEIDLASLAETLESIASDRPAVVVKTKQNGQYINAFVQGVPE